MEWKEEGSMEPVYICIDLKSFYASYECSARHLDPLKTNLVVADVSRTEKTICLAVSPSLKAYGLGGRARLFEVVQKVKEINAERLRKSPNLRFEGESFDADELASHPEYKLTYIAARPQMAKYIKASSGIYDIYLRYIAPEDIHVYSIDEVFMDVTHYLKALKMTPHELAMKMIRDVLKATGITATAGIGSNMYLAKVAMDIVAKHIPADKDGVRIAELNEQSYRELLWDHTPLTDFWRVGRGYVARLEKLGLHTMGDIALCSEGKATDFYNEDLLYKTFGINAELLIDHAWGYEPTTMEDIKSYRPDLHTLGSGQVLSCGYDASKARLIVKEMTELLTLDLVEKGLVTNGIALYLGYDIDNLRNPSIARCYKGELVTDYMGRRVPKPSHKSVLLNDYTSSTEEIMKMMLAIYDRIDNPLLLVRRINITALNVIPEEEVPEEKPEQLSLFTDYHREDEAKKARKEKLARERKAQEAILAIKTKYGKNAAIKGMNLEEGGTTLERNEQIGGHKA